jgi:uncharacterized protein
MNNNKNCYTIILKYLGGLFFLIPLLHPFFLAILLITNFPDNKKYEISKKRALTLIRLISVFLPIIISANILSAHLLSDRVPQKIVQSISSSGNLLIINCFSIIVVSPIVEELYFRKILFQELLHRFGSMWTIILSSIYFSFVHLNVLSLPTLFALGLLLGTVAQVTKSIIFCMLVHSLFNLSMLFLLIF